MRILLIFSIIIAYNSLHAQFSYPMKKLEPIELIVTYSLTYQIDSLNPDNIKQENMLLFLGENISLFLSSNSWFIENEMQKISSQAELQQWIDNTPPSSFMSNFRYRIFKNYPNNKITYTEKIMPNLLLYEEDLNICMWDLSTDTASIKGFKTQMAKSRYGGRNWEAWFTNEIPYSDGPYKFNGLPGLIVKISDNNNQYIFELVSIEKPSEEQWINYGERHYIVTSKQGFLRAKKSMREDIISRTKEAGLDSESQQVAAKNIAKRNNSIELE